MDMLKTSGSAPAEGPARRAAVKAVTVSVLIPPLVGVSAVREALTPARVNILQIVREENGPSMSASGAGPARRKRTSAVEPACVRQMAKDQQANLRTLGRDLRTSFDGVYRPGFPSFGYPAFRQIGRNQC